MHTQETIEKRDRFLHLLADGGNVSVAAEKAGLARGTVYKWRGEDEAFADAWDRAMRIAGDILEEEARRRAMGFEETVYVDGEAVGTSKKYSDTLLIFLLKGVKPEKYRERYDVATTGNITVNVVTGLD